MTGNNNSKINSNLKRGVLSQSRFDTQKELNENHYYGKILKNIHRVYHINSVAVLRKITSEIKNNSKNSSTSTLIRILDLIQNRITSLEISPSNNIFLTRFLSDRNIILEIVKNREITQEFLAEMFELFRKYRQYLPIDYLRTLYMN